MLNTDQRGLFNLVEQCNKLGDTAGRMTLTIADDHWDDSNSVLEKLENDIADVLVAMAFVAEQFNLDQDRMCDRIDEKMAVLKTETPKELNSTPSKTKE